MTPVLFLVPWCVAVGAAIVLLPRVLTWLVHLCAEPPLTPLYLLAHYACTAYAYICIIAAALFLAVAAPSGWLLRPVLLGAVGVRAAMVVRRIEA